MSFEPITPREALLEIRRQVLSEGLRRSGHEPDFSAGLLALSKIDEIAQAGLERYSVLNSELTDQLADRLAEAHKALRAAAKYTDEDPQMEYEIQMSLALPPDLEAMVERRIGPRG